MKAKDVDRLIQVVGVVTRAHVIKSLEYKRYLKCKMKTCNKCFSVSANFETEGYEIGVEGLLCDRQKSNKANDVCGNNKFDVIHKDFCDFQEVKIQESSSTLRTGAIPRSLTLILTHDMCNKVNPGDEVRATGGEIR
jgi:DNA replicative helicase MCM subunit Mcm2 (Cdc46/Mcm family)